MNGRERLTNMIYSRPIDRLSWTTIVDDTTRSIMSESLRNMNIMDFYRYIGCDIFQFGNASLKSEEFLKYPYKFSTPEIIEEKEYIDNKGYTVLVRKTDYGDLTSYKKNGRPVGHPVQNIEDVRILKKIWNNAEYILDDDGCAESYERMNEMIGNDGIYIPISEPSPIQTLIEYEMGLENFYYMLNDYETEMEELLSIMNYVKMQEYTIMAEKMPFIACIPVENTSTALTSPKIYKKYCVPFMRDFVDLMHKNNKKAILHMCGHLNNILSEIKENLRKRYYPL